MQAQPEPIATFADGSLSIRGFPIEQLIGKASFVETLILTLTGEFPTPLDPRVQLINAILVAWADHGEAPPSTQNVRNAASVGVPLHAAAASGLMCFGGIHAPVEEAAKMLQCMVARSGDREALLYVVRSYGKHVPGLGHPVHHEDPRTSPLLTHAGELGFPREYVTALHFARNAIHGKPPINLAGVTAALWLDMGFSVETVGLIPIIGRSVGLAAHYQDQRRNHPAFKGTPP